MAGASSSGFSKRRTHAGYKDVTCIHYPINLTWGGLDSLRQFKGLGSFRSFIKKKSLKQPRFESIRVKIKKESQIAFTNSVS